MDVTPLNCFVTSWVLCWLDFHELISTNGCLWLPLSAEEVAKRLEKEETPPRLDER
jgi:hypothetical protein